MRASSLLPAAGLVVLALSGCLGGDDLAPQAVPDTTLITVDADTGEELFLKPHWEVGRWWKVHLATDFGFGFLQDFDGKLVVSQQRDDGWTVGSDNEIFGVFDSYFDSFYVGAYDRDLNPTIKDVKVKLFDWPLRENQTWVTDFPPQDFDTFGDRLDQITLAVTRFSEDSDLAAGPRLRIQGNTSHGESIDYDYAPLTGWMTYFRMVNTTTGQVVVSVDFKESGVGFAGDVHHVSRTVVHEHFAFLTPAGEAFALLDGQTPQPPVATFDVSQDFTFVDEIFFLFSFPLGSDFTPVPVPFGAAEVNVLVGHPDATVDNKTFTGAGDKFESEFDRIVIRENVKGTWTVSGLAAGTGGYFAGFYGFKDELLAL